MFFTLFWDNEKRGSIQWDSSLTLANDKRVRRGDSSGVALRMTREGVILSVSEVSHPERKRSQSS
jgi:hypothetical protein